jgi:hypothetical protein
MGSDAIRESAPSSPAAARALPAAAIGLAALAILTRRPDLVRTPQLFAEDGQFYALAHNAAAFSSWFTQSNGYLQLAARLVASAAQLVPLAWAPAVVLAAAVLVDAAPAAFLVSGRMRSAIPSVWARILLAALYVALPGANHVLGVLAYSQWHLSLLAFLILIADPPATKAGRVLDVVVVALSGLSGPYSILLAPIAVVHWYLRPSVRTGSLAAVLLVTGAVQAVVMTTIGASMRSTAPRGATPLLLFRVIGGRVFYGATLGHSLQSTTTPQYPLTFGNNRVIAVVGAAGLALLAVAAWRGTHELRMAVAYGAAIVAAVLVNASAGVGGPPQWVVLANQDALPTYFVIPIMVVYSACVWMVTRREVWWRATGAVVLLLALALGIRKDWRELPIEDVGFSAAVRAYEDAPPGATVTVPIPPASWSIELVKPSQ